jgi:SSS family solute:Na+ symporter
MNQALFIGCTIVYIIVTAYLGYLGWKHTKGSEDFMLAGRKVHPWIIGLSYGATFISTSAIIGFGGQAAKLGMGLIYLCMLNIGLGILIAFVVFGKPTRRLAQSLKAVTFPDLMGKRFNSRFMQYATGFMILVAMPLYASAVLIGGAQFLGTTLGIDTTIALLIFAIITAVYVVLGGLIAVMYTDAMQGIIMIIGMVILLVLTYSLLGGVGQANADLTALGSSGLVPSDLAGQGFISWTSLPELGSPIWYTMITTIIMGVGIGVLAQPQLVVRFMTAKNDRALTKAIPIGAIFILITTGVAYTVGPLTNLWFVRTGGTVAWTSPEILQNGLPNVDKIMPVFINGSMPELFVVIFMLVLLAAAMSTLSSIFHTMGTSAGYDVWKHLRASRLFKRGSPDDFKATVYTNRVATGLMIMVSVVLALAMPTNIIARATAMFMGLCACSFLPAFCMALFMKKPSRTAAVFSLTAGAVSWFFWTVFVHTAEASQLGICKAIFGQVTLLGFPFNVIDPLMIGLPVAVVALIAGWAYDRMYLEAGSEQNGRAGAGEQ